MSETKAAKALSKQLRNIGPKMASRLVAVGIDTPEKLRQMGAPQAFCQAYATGDNYGDYNAAYLYALEGAIRNVDWKDLPEDVKQSHRKLAQSLQAEKKQKQKKRELNETE